MPLLQYEEMYDVPTTNLQYLPHKYAYGSQVQVSPSYNRDAHTHTTVLLSPWAIAHAYPPVSGRTNVRVSTPPPNTHARARARTCTHARAHARPCTNTKCTRMHAHTETKGDLLSPAGPPTSDDAFTWIL